MTSAKLGKGIIWGLAAFLLLAVGLLAKHAGDTLGRPSLWTGYSLFALFLVLAAFNLRKRLSMIPLGRAFWWYQVHIAGGVLAIALYLLHVNHLWPPAGYERLLAILVYVVLASGLVGYWLQAIAPQRLTQNEGEIIFERIPSALAEIREEVTALVIEFTTKFGSETLALFYRESLDAYLRRPHFVINHLFGGRLAACWSQKHFRALRQYTSDAENEYVDRIQALIERKSRIDLQYSQQAAMKLWLLIHIPAAVAVILFIFWHLLLVNIYLA